MDLITRSKIPPIYIYQLGNTIAQLGISLWEGETQQAKSQAWQANQEIQLFFPNNQEFQEIVNSKLAEMGFGVKVETLSELPLVHHRSQLHRLSLLCQYKSGLIAKSIYQNRRPSPKNLAQLFLFLRILHTGLIREETQ